MDKASFSEFHCWVADGPVDNFLLHSKSTRPDGSFEYLCQSFDSVEKAIKEVAPDFEVDLAD